ncbi:MAG: hypothetical protein K1X88_15870 [Nannocystaceae bacterium]|nr:hypothetical protein [Nannocystaceae bacterium]
MCRRVQCSQCGKPTFAGCGAHVEQVLGDVPRDQRCRCAEARESAPRREGEQRSWLDVLLGR